MAPFPSPLSAGVRGKALRIWLDQLTQRSLCRELPANQKRTIGNKKASKQKMQPHLPPSHNRSRAISAASEI